MRVFTRLNQSDRATNPNVVMITGVYFPEINGATLQCMKVISLLKREVDFKVITTTKYSNLVDYKVVDEVDIFRFYTGNYFSKFFHMASAIKNCSSVSISNVSIPSSIST